jgi:hypothetical protein|nr:MAG TPA: protein of unknown function DUF5067 [Bacteriophage sp.]DAR11149.1 MAG TPA: protein of unknown function (DUF5067) [Bacteriophage sp.]DAV77929.1 MAG TPA: protein of unknown function (DUF5067) [Bacteriophage sp.]
MKKKKKLYIGLAIAFVLVLIIVYGNRSTDTKTENTNTTTEKSSDNATYNNTEFKYLKHEIINNNEKDILIVYFDFTNNSKDNTRAAYNYDINCFQNGVELDYPLLKVVKEEDNIMKEIQPNTSITIAEAFILNDRSNVDLEVEAHSSFIDKKLIKLTLELQ